MILRAISFIYKNFQDPSNKTGLKINLTNNKIFVICLGAILFFNQNINAQNKSQLNLVNQIKMIILSQIDSLHNEFVRMENDSSQNNRVDFHQLIGASDSEINIFKNSLNELDKQISGREGKKEALQLKLNSLKLKKISALPEFYNRVHISLQKKIDKWKDQKNLTDKKILEPYLNKNKNVSGNVQNRIVEDTLKGNSPPLQTNNEFKDIEIKGLVVDETQTKLGHDFYDLFYQKWDSPQLPNDFTIVISEKPIPSLGTQISVKINDTQIFENRLQTRYELIEELADYAVQLSMNYLQNYEEIQKELNGDEMKGSGIF